MGLWWLYVLNLAALTSSGSFIRDASLWTNSTALSLPHTWTSLAGTPTKLHHHYTTSGQLCDAPPTNECPGPCPTPVRILNHLNFIYHSDIICTRSHDHHMITSANQISDLQVTKHTWMILSDGWYHLNSAGEMWGKLVFILASKLYLLSSLQVTRNTLQTNN